MARWLWLLGAVLVVTKAAGEGGETIETATVVPSFPYYDYSTTCGHVDDYDAQCPSGSTSSDLVYVVTPGTNEVAYFDVCNSDYNSKIYILAGDGTTLVDCDDWSCGYEDQAFLGQVPLEGGETYYVVVDGSNGECGHYELVIWVDVPCVVECPAGAMEEGEPPCVEGYVDGYNAGCWGGGWLPIYGSEDGCADVCGRACAYVVDGQRRADSDWYAMMATGTVTVAFEAEFDVTAKLIYGLDCLYPQLELSSMPPCAEGSVSWAAEPGQELWLVIYPNEEELVVEERSYRLHVCGIEGVPTPSDQTTWGKIKQRYRAE